MIDSRRQQILVVCALIAVHLAVAIPLAYLVNVWADEASSLYTTDSGIIAAIQGAIENERQAPLYFGILAAWRSLDHSIFFARLLSILFSIAAIKIFADLAFTNFLKRPAILSTCFFALHPFLFWASTEIRGYSLVLLLSVALILLFEKAFPAEPDSRKPFDNRTHLALVATSTISLYVNYYLGFSLVAFLFVLIFRRQWRSSFRYILLMLVVGLLSLPLFYVVASQMAVNTTGFQQDRPLWDGVRFIWHHVLTFLLPAEIFPDETSSAAASVRLILFRIIVLGTSILAIIRWRRISSRTCSYAVISVVTGLLFLASYLLVGENYVAIRHAAVLFVPLVLMAASGLSDLTGEIDQRPILRQALEVTAALVVLSFFTYSIFTLYPDMKKRGDWEQVASFVTSGEKAGDAILVFTTYDALAFRVYYRGSNPVLPDKNYFDFELEDKFGSPNSMAKRTDFAISQIPEGTARLWLVESEKCMTTDACVPLENYVRANYNVLDQKDFYRERVRLLIRKTK